MTTDEPIAELLSQRKLECELKLNKTESIYMPGKYMNFIFFSSFCIWIYEEPLQSFEKKI